MKLFHKHDYPVLQRITDGIIHSEDDNGNILITGNVEREVHVGDDWTCNCGKNFYVFTMKYDRKGNELPQWREVGKFK